jgi:hypothetical protein
MMSNEPNKAPLIFRPHTVGVGWRIPATYRTQNIPDYQGHPYIEALPPILTERMAGNLLGLFPRYDKEYRLAPNEERFHLIQSGLKFFTPLPHHLDLERRISCLIRSGYVNRNPLKPSYWESVEAAWAAMQDGIFPHTQSWSTAAGMTIIGMSGVGKTTTIERILNTYPQIIEHSNYKDQLFTQIQIVWLKLECPYDGEPKSVCINFFQMLDKVLGTDYEEEFGKDSRTAKVMLPDMGNLAEELGLGILVIDEIQRLSHSRSGGAGRLLEFIGQLINTIGVPVLKIGTFKAQRVLTQEVRQIRRGTGQGDMLWYPMKENAIWKHFNESLWKYQYTREVCSLTDELSSVLYSETQGIPDFAVKVYMLSQIRAITSKNEIINADIIESVARDSLQTAAPFLKALREKDIKTLEKYEDVPRIDFEEIIRQELNQEVQAVNINENNDSAASNNTEEAKYLTDSPQHGGKTRRTSANDKVAQKDSFLNKARRSPSKRSRPITKTPKAILPKIVAESNTKENLSPHEALKRTGYICHVDEFLTMEGTP